MILSGVSLSPFVRKVLTYAAEKGIALEHRPGTPDSSDPDFLARSSWNEVPALLDADYRLSGSSAIIAYLEARFPEPALIPLEPRARGRAVWYEEFADTIMFPVANRLFSDRSVAPLMLKQPGDPAGAAAAEAQALPPVLDYLEQAAPARGFIVGDSLSIGDIAIVSQLIYMEHAHARIDAAHYPKLAGWYGRLTARPSIAGLIAAEQGMLGQL